MAAKRSARLDMAIRNASSYGTGLGSLGGLLRFLLRVMGAWHGDMVRL